MDKEELTFIPFAFYPVPLHPSEQDIADGEVAATTEEKKLLEDPGSHVIVVNAVDYRLPFECQYLTYSP